MRRPGFLLVLAACANQPPASPPPGPPPTNSPQDLAYCAKLSQLYQRYVGADPSSSSMAGVTPDVRGGEAVAKCREGDAKASIPALERLLRDADIALPPRT